MKFDTSTLQAMIKAAPDQKLVVWVVAVEDCYETLFGDGFYSYVEKAFLREVDARCWAKWINDSTARASSSGYNATISSMTLTHGDAKKVRVLELLNDGGSSWAYIIQYCQEIGGLPPPAMEKLIEPSGAKPQSKNQARLVSSQTITKVRKDNLSLWNELKDEVNNSPGPYSWGEPPTSLAFLDLMIRAVERLPLAEKALIIAEWKRTNVEAPPAPDKKILERCAEAMVGQLVDRAIAVVDRYGYYP